MSGNRIPVDQLAAAVMDGLTEYANLASEKMKSAVKKAGNTVKKDIQANAPERTGKYAKSWRTKTMKETSQSLEITIYSPSKYMLAHLLEHGHAKRNGGRTRAIPHIAPAEEHGEEELLQDIEKALRG